MQQTVFIEKVPTVEIRDGIFFVGGSDTGSKSAMPIYIAKQLVRRAQAVLAIHDAQQAVVICEHRRTGAH